MGYSQTTQVTVNRYTGYILSNTEFIADATEYSNNTNNPLLCHRMVWLEQTYPSSMIRFRFETQTPGSVAGDWLYFTGYADGIQIFQERNIVNAWTWRSHDVPVSWDIGAIIETYLERTPPRTAYVRNFSVRGEQQPIIFD